MREGTELRATLEKEREELRLALEEDAQERNGVPPRLAASATSGLSCVEEEGELMAFSELSCAAGKAEDAGCDPMTPPASPRCSDRAQNTEATPSQEEGAVEKAGRERALLKRRIAELEACAARRDAELETAVSGGFEGAAGEARGGGSVGGGRQNAVLRRMVEDMIAHNAESEQVGGALPYPNSSRFCFFANASFLLAAAWRRIRRVVSSRCLQRCTGLRAALEGSEAFAAGLRASLASAEVKHRASAGALRDAETKITEMRGVLGEMASERGALVREVNDPTREIPRKGTRNPS